MSIDSYIAYGHLHTTMAELSISCDEDRMACKA